MIELLMPSPSQQYYTYTAGGFLVGPYGLTTEDKGTSVNYRSNFDTLEESKGIYSENTVIHSKLVGQFNVNPAIALAKRAPTSTYPDAVSIRVKDTANVLKVMSISYGVLYDGASAKQYQFSTSTNTAYLYTVMGSRSDFTTSRTRYYVPVSGKPTADVQVNLDRYVFLNTSSTKVNYQYYNATLTIPKGEIVNYTYLLSSSFIRQMIAKYGSKLSWFKSTSSTPRYTLADQADVNIEVLKKKIDSELRMAGDWDLFPIADTDFGELAMDAVKKIDRNNVNMIAFLRDLKDPSALIPKLRNLSKLKTHAGNYLAAEYGILPTISDLSAIVDAFKKVKPYVDRNGFSTYSAVRSSFEAIGNISYTLEQRIKVAVQDNDSMLIDLIDRIESAGFGLTFQNIWDLIPYSFVLDWFIDVGGMLERVDTRLRLLRMHIPYATQSRKQQVTFPSLVAYGSPLDGSLSQIRYKRWAVDHCPVPTVFTSGPPTAANHWLEAGALLMQRSK